MRYPTWVVIPPPATAADIARAKAIAEDLRRRPFDWARDCAKPMRQPRRFPPLAGRGRGYRLDVTETGQMTIAEHIARAQREREQHPLIEVG